MSADEQTQFLQQLAEDLNSKNVELPSFPDVVINIRRALEDPNCTSDRLGEVVRTDPVLVAKLLMMANSAFYNRAGIEIVDLNLAISRMGFEEVRNTAISLAVQQLFKASEHQDIQEAMKKVWDDSLSLASMAFVIARHSGSVNPDNAYLAGLLHEIGKLYILTRARNYPSLMGDADKLNELLVQWTPSIGQSIVESWGFPPEIAESLDVEENLRPDDPGAATIVDVIHVAKCLLDESDDAPQPESASMTKLRLSEESVPGVREAWETHATSMRKSAAG